MISARVIDQICDLDSAFSILKDKFPNYPLVGKPADIDPFETLVETIISQQLSGKAAQTIISRVKSKTSLSVSAVLDVPESKLREAGLSGAKIKSVKCLASRISSGMDLAKVIELPENEIREQLIDIWGIGNWTVDMFLMFRLHHPDVWPINDLGVQKGWQILHQLPNKPSPDELKVLGEKFSPIRSAVAWYCWRALEI